MENFQTTTNHRQASKPVKVLSTDILVIPEVVEQNQTKLAQHQRRKRRINYIKKISNDTFIFNV